MRSTGGYSVKCRESKNLPSFLGVFRAGIRKRRSKTLPRLKITLRKGKRRSSLYACRKNIVLGSSSNREVKGARKKVQPFNKENWQRVSEDRTNVSKRKSLRTWPAGTREKWGGTSSRSAGRREGHTGKKTESRFLSNPQTRIDLFWKWRSSHA